MSYARLVELFVTGRVNADSYISKEAASFRPARTYPELARFVSSSALRWEDDLPGAAEERSLIDVVTLPSHLFDLAVRRETGALVLHDGVRRKKVFFVEGAPEFVASTERSELLGEQLVSRGQVLRMEIDMALAMLPRFGGRVGDALVGLGVLRPIELFRAIAEQTQERFSEILRWRTGEMAFLRGARSHEETFPLGIDALQLIARGVRQHYSIEEVRTVMLPLTGCRIDPVVPLPVRLETYRFSSREERVLRRIDGKATVGEIVESYVKLSDPDETLRTIFLGLSFEVLTCPRWRQHKKTSSSLPAFESIA
jgi:serine/threonine-protein kinase